MSSHYRSYSTGGLGGRELITPPLSVLDLEQGWTERENSAALDASLAPPGGKQRIYIRRGGGRSVELKNIRSLFDKKKLCKRTEKGFKSPPLGIFFSLLKVKPGVSFETIWETKLELKIGDWRETVRE